MMSECVTHVALVFRPVAECLESALIFETKLAVGRRLLINYVRANVDMLQWP